MSVHTVNRIRIAADPDLIFGIAADVERWPEFLEHYRVVRVLSGGEPRRVFMAATRTGIPVSWSSTQRLLPDQHVIRYHHVAGVTRGMEVEWRIRRDGAACEVTIDHDLVEGRFWLRWGLAEYVVGRVFVMHIADQTLAGVKRHAETLAGQRS